MMSASLLTGLNSALPALLWRTYLVCPRVTSSRLSVGTSSVQGFVKYSDVRLVQKSSVFSLVHCFRPLGRSRYQLEGLRLMSSRL